MSTADNLRQVADLLDAHPDLPQPVIFIYSSGTVDCTWQILRDAEDTQRDTMNRIRRALGGEWRKEGAAEDFYLKQRRGQIDLGIIAKRDAVCERVVTGVETVTIPAVEAQPERVETREVVEWRCDPILTEAATR